MYGTYEGTVVERDNPPIPGRIRATIPGEMEITNWAKPDGGGAANWGSVDVPPLGASVYIVFLNGDPQVPIYRPADYGVVDGKPEVFKEHVHPDVHVWGRGPFRLVIDNRDPEATGEPRTARLKLVKEIGGEEQDIAWIEISEENSIQIYADSAVEVKAGALVNVDSDGAVQVKGRKVMPQERPIN